MGISSHEEKAWAIAWMLVGLPAMVVGFLVGYGHGNAGLMIGTVLVAIIILFTCRDIWMPERTTRPCVVLEVRDFDERNKVGLLEVKRGAFRPGDVLSVLSIRLYEHEELKVYIRRSGQSSASAGSLVVRNGTFRRDQRLMVESVSHDVVNSQPTA